MATTIASPPAPAEKEQQGAKAQDGKSVATTPAPTTPAATTPAEMTKSSGSGVKLETLEANRIRSALDHRKLIYREIDRFDQLLLYHRQWLEQPPIPRATQLTPDATTLDSRGDDLPPDQIHALARQSQIKAVALKAAKAIEGDHNLLHVDRYIYWHETRAPPTEWSDILPFLLQLHDASSGFLVTDIGLPPPKPDVGFTWLSGFVDEKWAHYLKYSLDTTMSCSTYLLDPAPWLRGEITKPADGAERLTHMSNSIRYFRRFPSEEPALLFRKFMLPINGKLVEHMANHCALITIIDHQPGRRPYLLKLVAKILRNRHKPNNPLSKSKGLNYYIPAVQGLRKERDENQRLFFVRGLQNLVPSIGIKQLLEMPLNELRVKYWTFHHNQDQTHSQDLKSPNK